MEKYGKTALKRANREILRSAKTENGGPEWIKDNLYLIDRVYKNALRNSGRAGIRMAEAMDKYFREKGFKADGEKIAAFLSAGNEDYSLAEIRSLTGAVCAAAVIALGNNVKNNAHGTTGEIVKMLFALDDLDTDTIESALWESEKLLKLYEPGYEDFDAETKAQYRTLAAGYAKKRGISENEAVKELAQKALKGERTIGETLFDPGKKGAVIWFITALLQFLPTMAAACIWCGPAALLFTLPIAAAAVYSADFSASFFAKSRKAPRMACKSVPDGSGTLVAVTTLLFGGESDKKAFESLERFACMTPDENVFFCLLADLPDSERRYNAADAGICEKAEAEITLLNRKYGERFCLFLREREYNPTEESFGGFERKRGAVCELVGHIMTGNKSCYLHGGEGFIRNIKYLLTLDSDTELTLGSVNELVSVARHPANRPKVKNGKVVSGYGIIQPAIRTGLSSAYATGFSRMTSGDIGSERYASASFRRGQDLFGSGSFCGKGLIDVGLFYGLVCGQLPDGKILSHDTIEGGILRTLYLSDVSLTDSTPSNPVSYYRRQHRWMRGDFQNLRFLFSKKISALPKARIALSALRHVCPLFAVAGLAACLKGGPYGVCAFLFAYSYILVPSTLYALRYILRGSPFAAIRYFSHTLTVLAQITRRAFYDIVSSARQAFLALNAALLALIRSLNGRKTLQWTTAAQAEKLASGLGKYVLDGAYSLLFGLALLIFAPLPFARLSGLIFFVYPLVSVVLSLPLNGGSLYFPSLSAAKKDVFRAHARDMWRFYSDNVSERTGWLPPDNIQLSPVASTAMRTSPTNIGFYLVSAMAANDFGFITEKELYERLYNTLSAVETLQKYRGNLFNWYGLPELEPIGGRFVSSVDSGNFTAMLSALLYGLYERDPGEKRDVLIKKCLKLIGSTDLGCFYDKKRGLFRIGCGENGDTDGIGRYDMLMSEMRLTSYYAVATGAVPKKHWQSLSRSTTARRGFIGMLSWSGTAFEYLMPQLFLPLYRDSFIFESVAFAVSVQRSGRRIWGISESAFYGFDSEMQYRYKAHGVSALALRRVGNDEEVVSPYSSYLAACVCPNEALKNLDRLCKKGMYGKYGMYEALDLNGGNCLAVKSYMAHHVGMSIVACANICKNGIFVKRFTADGRIASVREILTEPVPQSPHIFKPVGNGLPSYGKRAPQRSDTGGEPDLCSPRTVLLSRGSFAFEVSDDGTAELKSGETLIARGEGPAGSPFTSLAVAFLRNGNAFFCAKGVSGGKDGTRYRFEATKDHAAFIAAGADFSGRVKYALSKSGDCLVIETRAEAAKKYDVALCFEPVLDTPQNFYSHVAFSRLFVESEYDAEQNIIYFHRRSREDGSHIFTCAVAPRDKKARLRFTTGANGTAVSPEIRAGDVADIKTDGYAGACVTPLCLAKICGAEAGHTAFLVAGGATKNECASAIRAARCDLRYLESRADALTEAILTSLRYGGKGGKTVDKFTSKGRDLLWSRGISGDLPVVLCKANKPDEEKAFAVAKAFLALARGGKRFELVFLTDDGDLYHRPAETALVKGITRAGAGGFIGAKGGIFILRSENGSEAEELLKTVACACFDIGSSPERPRIEPRENAVTEPENGVFFEEGGALFRTANGYFDEKGYAVDKRKPLYAPYSYVLAGRRFGSVVTQDDLGLTFFDNSHERRLCAFTGDAYSGKNGERLLLYAGGKAYDVCAVSNSVRFGEGHAVYRGSVCGIGFELCVFVCEKYPLKLLRLKTDGEVKTVLEAAPVMGNGVLPSAGIEKKELPHGRNRGVIFKNPVGTFAEGYGFIGVCGGTADVLRCRAEATGEDTLFFIGACGSENGAERVASLPDARFFEAEKEKAAAFAESFSQRFSFYTNDAARDVLLHVFVPYQIAASRFFARGSFYQTGGAYGFRDQLQDCLALVYFLPDEVRTHILRCCAHQYEDGSVMHWWHTVNERGLNRGVKSGCSDDLLYLPFCVSEYIERTGDGGILDFEVGYLSSPPLKNGERERYELAEKAKNRESVYRHCLRTFARARSRTGAKGLLLTGSCDWNDAFSLIGENGGESVFTTLLYVHTAERFARVCDLRGDCKSASVLRSDAERFRKALEDKAFYGDRYARAFTADGTPLGVEGSGECETDILSQAWAAIAGLDGKRVKKALSTAFVRLYDRKNRIFKLFDPPFVNGRIKAGYIRGYAAGLRENGGQYSHAAIWGAVGMIKAGMAEEAKAVLSCTDPSKRCITPEEAKRYATEPYVLAADIYAGDRAGRGGWSWYTGAAAWFYKAHLEYLFGIDLKDGLNVIDVRPKTAFKAVITRENGVLTVEADVRFEYPSLDGERKALPIKIPEGDHTLRVPLEK